MRFDAWLLMSHREADECGGSAAGHTVRRVPG
jgi:hypothetical protein